MENKDLAADEARRVSHLQSIRSQVETDVNASIARRAEQTSAPEARSMEKVAGELRGNAIESVAGRDREVERTRSLARVAQFINYAFGVVYTLLAVRLVLGLVAARSTAGFVKLINSLTNPFYSMFRGIVASPSIDGGYTLVVPVLVAMAAYGVLHLGILGVLRLIAHRETQL